MYNRYVKSVTDEEFQSLQKTFLELLKEDPEHRINFDKRMSFTSSRYGNILLSARDIHYDPEQDELVLVGVSRKGLRKYTGSDTDEYSIPLREVFDDMKAMGMNKELDLLQTAKRSVVMKYLVSPMLSIHTFNGFNDDALKLSTFFDRKVISDIGIEKFNLLRMEFDANGNPRLFGNNEMEPEGFYLDVDKIPMQKIQKIGFVLGGLVNTFKECHHVFSQERAEKYPLSMTEDARDEVDRINHCMDKVWDMEGVSKEIKLRFSQFVDPQYRDSALLYNRSAAADKAFDEAENFKHRRTHSRGL